MALHHGQEVHLIMARHVHLIMVSHGIASWPGMCTLSWPAMALHHGQECAPHHGQPWHCIMASHGALQYGPVQLAHPVHDTGGSGRCMMVISCGIELIKEFYGL